MSKNNNHSTPTSESELLRMNDDDHSEEDYFYCEDCPETHMDQDEAVIHMQQRSHNVVRTGEEEDDRSPDDDPHYDIDPRYWS